MSSEKFYHDIPSFDDFVEFTNADNYYQAPDDWLVVISDVAGSTKAIQRGEYKTVNMVGASTVVAIVNALEERDIPFVFGGDGSTAVIPPKNLERVKLALMESQKKSLEEFGLNLRIGIVPHSDLLKFGTNVQIGKFRLAKSVYLAFFKGNALALAEKWVKEGRYLLPPTDQKIDFDPHQGLSCRWAPLKNKRGMMLSILVKIQDEERDPQLMKKIINEIDEAVDLDHHDSHPVSTERMAAEKISKAVGLEVKFSNAFPILKSIKIFLFILLAKAFEKKWIRSKKFNMDSYKKSVRQNSDFRKYDETLRMVIDCDSEMKEKIETLLKHHAEKGEIFYGLYASETALMTCFVHGVQDHQHIHFIDGGDGGYAMAALSMKEQIRNSKV